MGGWIAVFIALLIIGLSIAWVSIPKKNVIETSDAWSLAFADGVLVGWADRIGVWLFYPSEGITKEEALDRFRQASVASEQEIPIYTAVLYLAGSFLSIGGLVAIWLARNADNAGQAFKMGFWAEIIEGMIYHIGYKDTMGYFNITAIEIGATLAAAIIMGGIAVYVKKSHN